MPTMSVRLFVVAYLGRDARGEERYQHESLAASFGPAPPAEGEDAAKAEAAETFEEVAARAAVPEYRRWHRADDRRHELRQVWRDFFATEVDVLICPVFSRAAFPHTGDDGAFWPFWRDTGRTMEIDGTSTPYQRHVFWSGKHNVPIIATAC